MGDDFLSITDLREHICKLTDIPATRQTLIIGGRRLPFDDEAMGVDEAAWVTLKSSVRPGQVLMLIGTVPSPEEGLGAAGSGEEADGSAVAEGSSTQKTTRQTPNS